MADGEKRGRRLRRAAVGFSARVARRVCERVASGESMNSISRDPGMPSRSTITRWARVIPLFAQRLRRAQAAGGWSPGGKPPGGYCEVTAREIFARLCEGEALTAICEDPGMPGTSTVYRWREATPEFARMMALARQVQAERFCDLGWEIASAVTPGDAYATHVKLMHLRWTAGALAPKRFGRVRPVDADEVEAVQGAAVVEQRIVLRHFKVEEREDGAYRVVAFRPDSRTGHLVRESSLDDPWLPGPAGRWRPGLAQRPAAERAALLGLDVAAVGAVGAGGGYPDDGDEA